MRGPPIVGYQGEPGAFSEDAARQLVPGAETRGYPTFDDVARAVAEREIEYAVLPVENSISGPIPRVYDLLWLTEAIVVVAERIYRVEQTLIGVPGSTLATLREVRSHPVALEQCRALLATHPEWRATIVADTAGAVREIVELADPSVAAIASTLAAERYRATVLRTNVQDRADNFTRFFLLRRSDRSDALAPAAEPSRACIALSLANRAGSLRDALASFADRGLDLRSIVSRPTDVAFTYRFYLEIASAGPEALAAALAEIDGTARVMGHY